ncbi:MAG: rhodanese-like domain-containing protein [Candidatus Brocadiae bacterium]|nr:rhodanese-like domain-containing protein [Candidatus Brocadiia bacterium]
MIQRISNAQVATELGKPHIVVVDVRQPEEYAARHIPGALLAPHTDIEVYLGDLPRDKDLYVICEAGMRSHFACEVMESSGFTRLFNVVPGMSQWQGPVEKGLPQER